LSLDFANTPSLPVSWCVCGNAGVYLPERCSIVELRDDATLEVPVPDTSQPYESRKDRGAKYKEVRPLMAPQDLLCPMGVGCVPRMGPAVLLTNTHTYTRGSFLCIGCRLQ